MNEQNKNLSNDSWIYNCIPEYIWIALIINKNGRKIGLEKLSEICCYLAKDFKLEIRNLKFSSICSLSENDKHKVCCYIKEKVGSESLDPLCVFLDSLKYKNFYVYFNCTNEFQIRLKKINEIMLELSDFQSELSSDVHFINVTYGCIVQSLDIQPDVIKNLIGYLKIEDVSNEETNRIKDSIRETAVSIYNFEKKNPFSDEFWKKYNGLNRKRHQKSLKMR